MQFYQEETFKIYLESLYIFISQTKLTVASFRIRFFGSKKPICPRFFCVCVFFLQRNTSEETFASALGLKYSSSQVDTMAELRQILKDFILNFTSHGFRRVIYPIGSEPTKISKGFRLIWFLVWAGAMIYMCMKIKTTFETYWRHDKITSISEKRGEPVEFPAVTICKIDSTKDAVHTG